jgi:hypothetical protein
MIVNQIDSRCGHCPPASFVVYEVTMKPLFTIHAGEFIVGSFIERTFKRVNTWVPAKDTGVDLLASDAKNRKAVSLQVKTSRDFLVTDMGEEFQKPLRACGWWTLNRQKIETSLADYWIFVIVRSATHTDFVLITPAELLKRLDAIHGQPNRIQSYLWITEERMCWEARGLRRADQLLIAEGQFRNNPNRDFSVYLDNWEPIKALND